MKTTWPMWMSAGDSFWLLRADGKICIAKKDESGGVRLNLSQELSPDEARALVRWLVRGNPNV